jgi:hypothetical protein
MKSAIKTNPMMTALGYSTPIASAHQFHGGPPWAAKALLAHQLGYAKSGHLGVKYVTHPLTTSG